MELILQYLLHHNFELPFQHILTVSGWQLSNAFFSGTGTTINEIMCGWLGMFDQFG